LSGAGGCVGRAGEWMKNANKTMSGDLWSAPSGGRRSGEEAQVRRCSRRSSRHSPTGGGWRGSTRRCSMAEVNGEASRGD
jgi:hypothetical protein